MKRYFINIQDQTQSRLFHLVKNRKRDIIGFSIILFVFIFFVILTKTSRKTLFKFPLLFQSSSNEFRIYTKGCKIKDLPLFDTQTKRFFENKSKTIWKCDTNVINIHRINGTALRIDWSALNFKPLCYYRQLIGKDDFHNTFGKLSAPLTDPEIDLPDVEFVQITCFKNITGNFENITENSYLGVIHTEIIPLIPFVNKTSESSAPNVLLLAIDSTSFVNFKRHFIRTEKLLKKHQFFELRGYNKVGDNTFPNMIPFLTGYQFEELYSSEEKDRLYFDGMPLIWRKYAEQGFVTAFVEEMPKAGLFHMNRWGFKSRPTDYYTRPFQRELEKEAYNYYCYKNKAEFEIVLDWTYDFINVMNERQQKYFAYISISEMTHDWLNGIHYMDVPFNKFFERLFNQELLKDTMVLFFSDHGIRTGAILKTYSGIMENRLPFVFIHLPENTDKTYEENLRQNQYRLTTPYDIHATLIHSIQGKPNHSLPHGLSLFDQVISDNRDCVKASIPDIFCACYEHIFVDDISVIIPEQTIPKIVGKINEMTEKVRSKCKEFVFRAINGIYKRVGWAKTMDQINSYIVHLYVDPGMALFEALITSDVKNSGFEILGEITRINRYGNQSYCMTQKRFKSFCFCNDFILNNSSMN